jgi:peptide deformylase
MTPSTVPPLTPIPVPWHWNDQEAPLIAATRPDFDIVTRGSPEEGVLRRRTRLVDPKVNLDIIEARMESTMRQAKGVGLAGPQVGLGLRVATLMLDYKTDNPRVRFFRNPVIIERSDDTIEGYEGCLSIPGVGGKVRRSRWVKLSHDSFEGEALLEETEGDNAVLWQHELDHLEGILYIDKLVGELLPMDEVRRRRQELKKPAGPHEPSALDWGSRDRILLA